MRGARNLTLNILFIIIPSLLDFAIFPDDALF